MNTSAQKPTSVNMNTLIVTVDIGKATLSGYMRCQHPHVEVKPFDFANSLSGFKMFWEKIQAVSKKHNLDDIIVGIESTGCYGELLQHFLFGKPVRLVQVNPVHTKRAKEMTGNSPGKTDHKDPKVIADIIQLGHGLQVVIPEGHAAELRRLSTARERAIRDRTGYCNQLQDVVFVLFPELLNTFRSVQTKVGIFLLKHYCTPQKLLSADRESLFLNIRQVSRGKIAPQRIDRLLKSAASSAGIRNGTQAMEFEVQHFIQMIEAKNHYVAEIETQMARILEQIPCSRYILSLKGIGLTSTAGIIGEVGDFSQFRTQSELLKYAGLNLYEMSSGKHKGGRHITKRGRPLLRKILFFCALNTVRSGGVMHEVYQRHLAKGMKKIKALVAIARKLLGIIFALVKNNSNYEISRTLSSERTKAA